jgi:hypothetical protein
MDALATTGDLAVRNIDTANLPLADEMLRVASAAVRNAAGSPISETTSTIQYDGWLCDKHLTLIGQPITDVYLVTINGTSVTDWRLKAGGRLWRLAGWGVDDGPADVRVMQVHGLPVIPDDLVDLVCQLASVGIDAAVAGYTSIAGIVSEQTPEYSVTYAQGADAIRSAQIPERTRLWLASMFGGSAAMVTTRS